MNNLIRELALDAHLLNYIDLETPRHYFISGNADMEDVEKFAELVVRNCIAYCGENLSKTVGGALKIHFGIEE
jgi:hypothetical protein